MIGTLRVATLSLVTSPRKELCNVVTLQVGLAPAPFFVLYGLIYFFRFLKSRNYSLHWPYRTQVQGGNIVNISKTTFENSFMNIVNSEEAIDY